MTTVASRSFNSTPQRDAAETWRAIVDMLTQAKAGAAQDELLAVTGIAASLIADQAPKDAAIVVTCDGPRTRVYCLYDDDAIEGSDANEAGLGFDPLQGDWRVSLPCPAEDLAWVQSALEEKGSRITAREKTVTQAVEEAEDTGATSLTIDLEGFLGS
jgi:hypothetical protein